MVPRATSNGGVAGVAGMPLKSPAEPSPPLAVETTGPSNDTDPTQQPSSDQSRPQSSLRNMNRATCWPIKTHCTAPYHTGMCWNFITGTFTILPDHHGAGTSRPPPQQTHTTISSTTDPPFWPPIQVLQLPTLSSFSAAAVLTPLLAFRSPFNFEFWSRKSPSRTENANTKRDNTTDTQFWPPIPVLTALSAALSPSLAFCSPFYFDFCPRCSPPCTENERWIALKMKLLAWLPCVRHANGADGLHGRRQMTATNGNNAWSKIILSRSLS
jgi:hypothetical protein